MKLAFVYAGQGSQKVGMGRDFYQEFPQFAQVFDRAPVDFDLKKLCFEGPEEQLAQTRYTQPCMAAFAVGVTKLLYQEGRQGCRWGSIPLCMPRGCSPGRPLSLPLPSGAKPWRRPPPD